MAKRDSITPILEMDEDDLSDDDNLEVNNISNITLYDDHNNSNDNSIGSSIIREFPTPTMWKHRKLLDKSKLTSEDFNIIEESENEDLNNFQSLEKRLHTHCDEYKQLKLQLDIFQKQNKELQSEHKELVEYRCGIRVAPDSADYRSNYQNQIECLQLQLNETKDSNELLRNENKNYEEKNRNLLKEKELCEQEKIMIETKYDLLQKKFYNRDADLCSNIDALNMQITQLEHKICNIEKANESQRLEYETMSQQLVDALSENDSLLYKIKKSEHDEQLRIEEIKDLSHKLNECKITNNSLNIIALETDAIEYRNKIQTLEHQEQLRIKEIQDLNDILNEFKITNNTVNRITSESDDTIEYRNKIQKLELNENALINQIEINEKLLKNSELKIEEIQQMCTDKDAEFLIASNYINEMKSKFIEIKTEHDLLMQQLEKIQILSTNLETQNLELNQKLLTEKNESLILNEKYMKLLDSQKIFNNEYDVIRKIENSLNSIQNNNNNKHLNSITINDLYAEHLSNDIHLIENNINQFLQNSMYDNEYNDTNNNQTIINYKKEIFYKISDYENSIHQKFIKKLFELHQKYFQSINNNVDSVCNSEDKQFLNQYNEKFSNLEITLNNNTSNNIPKIAITDYDTFEKLKSNYEQLQINFIQMENSNKLLQNEINELYSEKKNLDTIIERNRIVIEETSEDFTSLRSKYILISEIIENLHLEKSDIQKNYAQIQEEFNSFKNVLKNANSEFANFFIELLNLHHHTQYHDDDDDEMDNKFIRLTDNVLNDTLNCFKYTKYNYKLLFNEYNTIFEQHYKSHSEKFGYIENLNISHFENSNDLKPDEVVVDEEPKRLTENGEEIAETVKCEILNGDLSLPNEIVEELNNEKLILSQENSLHLKLDLSDKFDKLQKTNTELQRLYDEKLTEIQTLHTKVLNTEQLNIELINKFTTLQDLYNEKLIEIDALNVKIINLDKFEVLQLNHLKLEESYNQKLTEIENLNIKFLNIEQLNDEIYDKLQVFQSNHLKLQALYDDKLVELETLNTELLKVVQSNNESINKYTKLQDLYNEKLIEIDTLFKKSINIEELNNEINTKLTKLQLSYSNLNKLHNEKQIEIDTLTVKLLDAEQLNEKQKTIQFDLIENIKKKDESLMEQISINNLLNKDIYKLEMECSDLKDIYNKRSIEFENYKQSNIKNCNLNEIETLTTKLTKCEQLNSLQIDKLNEVQLKYCELEKNHSIKLIEIEILTEKLLTNELLINKQTEELNLLTENSNQLHNDKLNEIENLTIKICDIEQLNTVQIENFNKLQNDYLDLDKFHKEKLNEIQILNEKLLTTEQLNSVQNEKLTKLQIEYAQLQNLHSKQIIEIENLNKNLKQLECKYQSKIKQYESVIEKMTKKYIEFKSDSGNDKNSNNSTTKQLKKNLQNILLENDELQPDENLRSERKSLQNERKSRRHATYDENRPTLQSDILKEIVDLSFTNIDSNGSANNSSTSNNNSNSNNNNVQQCQNCTDFENLVNDLRKELKVKNYQIIHNKMQIDHNPLLGEVDDLKNELKKSEQNNQRLRNDIKNINYKLQKVTSSNEQHKKCNECENKKSLNEQETQTNVSGSDTDPQNKQQIISLMSCENDLVSQVRNDDIKNELLSLQKKYDEVKKICRLRRTTIMELENKVLKLNTNESMEIIKKESIQLREQFNEFNEKLKKVQSEKEQYLQKRDELHKDFNRLQKLHCKTKLEMQLENDSLKEKIAALQNSLADKENDSKIAENLNSLELISQLQEENVLIKKNIMDLQQKCDRYKKQHLKNLQLQSTNKSANHQSVQTEEYDFDKKLLEEINVYKCKYKKAKDICESRLRQIQFLEDKCQSLQ